MSEVRISDIIIPKYYDLFNDTDHEHHILTSGRAGTKSSYMGIRSVYKIVSDDNCAVIILRKHHNKLRKTVYKEVIRAIKRLGLDKSDFKITKSPMEITYLPNGNTIYFTGSDSIDDTKGIIDEEKPIKLVVLDELTEFFDDGEGEDELVNIEATFVRGNDDEFQMLYLYNPPKNPNAPIVQWCKKMERREDVIHRHVDYRDVPVAWIGKKLIKTAEALLSVDEKLYNWTWLGESVGVDELIYYMFADRHRYRPEPDRIYETVYIGGDYGQQNATTYQAFGLDNYRRQFTGLGEYYHSGRETGRQRSPSDYAQDLVEFMDSIHEQHMTKVFYIYLDPSAKGLQEEIKRATRNLDYQVIVKDAENDVALGISRVQKALIFGVLTVAPAQTMAVEEFGLYEYDKKSIEKGKEVPIKANDHCMDAIRYAVMGAWKRIKHWLPADASEDEYIIDIGRMEMDEVGYI